MTTPQTAAQWELMARRYYAEVLTLRDEVRRLKKAEAADQRKKDLEDWQINGVVRLGNFSDE